MDKVINLIMHSKLTLLDLDLGWCNMNFYNMRDLCECIKAIGLEDATLYNQGVRRGTFRTLNFSFNPCLRGDEHVQNKAIAD